MDLLTCEPASHPIPNPAPLLDISLGEPLFNPLHAQSLQSCSTLCDAMEWSPPDSYVRVFSKQEYWSGLPCPPPRDLSDPGIKPTPPVSPALQADSLHSDPPGKPNCTH